LKNKIIIYIISGLVLLVIGVSITGYYFYKQYQATQKSLQLSKDINKQNEQYYKDVVKQKKDSLQTLAGLVKNLNKEKFDIKKKWVTQVTSLQLQIQNIKVQDTASVSNGKDSLGEYLEVSFKGKKFITSYEGYTRHYLNLKRNVYSLDLNYDPIQLRSDFYKDVDNLWKLRTVSLTPGINILTDYYIDSTFYSMLNNYNIISNDKEEIIPFGIRLKAEVVGSWVIDSWYSQHTFDASAELYYRFLYITYHPLQKAAGFGIYYDLSLSKPLNFIKKIFSIF